jgi:hypothetical protein
VGDAEPTLGQQVLDGAAAQSEAQMEPDRVLDDFGRAAMTAVAERALPASYQRRPTPTP